MSCVGGGEGRKRGGEGHRPFAAQLFAKHRCSRGTDTSERRWSRSGGHSCTRAKAVLSVFDSQRTVHRIASHYIALHHIASHHIASHHIASHRITSHYIASHRITSHYIASHRITSHHIASHRITSHHIASHRITSHHITSHRITSRVCLF